MRKAAQELIYTLVNTCETHVWQSDRENIWNIQHSLCCMCSHSSCLEININKMPLWNFRLFRARSTQWNLFFPNQSAMFGWMRANECFVPALYAMILIVVYCGVVIAFSLPIPYMVTNTNYFLGLSTVTSHLPTHPNNTLIKLR